MTNVKIVHLSDLHFSAGRSKDDKSHVHSLEICDELSKFLNKTDVDRVIISGDLSDLGDVDSLLNVHDWLFDGLKIGGGEQICLNLTPDKAIIIPGNHDAFNNTSSSKLGKRWQTSLDNFNKIFIHNQIDPDDCCNYDWIEKENKGVFILYADSCYLGDDFFTERIAKGHISQWQSKIILKYFDNGSKGKLLDKRNNVHISSEKFTNSLKILVMHHYIFEPNGFKEDHSLKLKHKNTVFKNIAMADFDILLCGHKHISGLDGHTYGFHFDERGKKRQIFNCFRRLVGIESLPLQFETDDGKKLSRALTGLLSMLGFRSSSSSEADYIDSLITVLKQGLENPRLLEKEVKTYFKEFGFTPESVLVEDEIKELVFRIKEELTVEQRKRLNRVSQKALKDLMSKMDTRPFLQIMCGSTTKQPFKSFLETTKERYFNVYTIKIDNSGYLLESERFEWNGNGFTSSPIITFPFSHERKINIQFDPDPDHADDQREEALIAKYQNEQQDKIS